MNVSRSYIKCFRYLEFRNLDSIVVQEFTMLMIIPRPNQCLIVMKSRLGFGDLDPNFKVFVGQKLLSSSPILLVCIISPELLDGFQQSLLRYNRGP